MEKHNYNFINKKQPCAACGRSCWAMSSGVPKEVEGRSRFSKYVDQNGNFKSNGLTYKGRVFCSDVCKTKFMDNDRLHHETDKVEVNFTHATDVTEKLVKTFDGYERAREGKFDYVNAIPKKEFLSEEVDLNDSN